MFKQAQVGYALILGNILHAVFEHKVQQREMEEPDRDLVQKALKQNYTQIY